METEGDDYEWQPPTEAEMKVLQAKRERSNRISKLMGDYLLKGYKMLATSCPDCGTIYLQDKQKKNYCITCSELSSDTVKDDPALNLEAARRQVAEEHQRQSIVMREDSPEPEPPLPPPPLVTVGLNGNPEPQVRDSSSGSSRRTPHSRVPCRRSASECTQGAPPPPGLAPSFSNPAMYESMSSPQINTHSHGSDLRESVTSTSTSTMTSGRRDMSEPLSVVLDKITWATQELQRSVSVEGSIQLCQLVKACAETLTALNTIQNKD